MMLQHYRKQLERPGQRLPVKVCDRKVGCSQQSLLSRKKRVGPSHVFIGPRALRQHVLASLSFRPEQHCQNKKGVGECVLQNTDKIA